MLSFSGKCSVFGGKYDDGMKNDTGLSLYEPKEADKRADLFDKATNDEPLQATWKRLRITSYYCAYRFDVHRPRWRNQETLVRITNPKTLRHVMAHLVDWGPSEDTGRVIDVSPAVASALEIETDDVLDVEVDV